MRASRAIVLLAALACLLGPLSALGCGFGEESCWADDPNGIQVGLWLCENPNPAACGCDADGCNDAGGFRTYRLALDGGDETCDTLGGWRQDDLNFDGLFGKGFGSFLFMVHPDDMDKVNQYDVKVALHAGDYCTGQPATGGAFPAWDADQNQPGLWSLSTYDSSLTSYPLKSIRAYVDQHDDIMPGIGIKFVSWPQRDMGVPYDAIDCEGDRFLPNVDGGCASAVSQAWCIPPGKQGDDWSGSGVLDGEDFEFAGNLEAPKAWVEDTGGIPIGSFMFQFRWDDGALSCDTSWQQFCSADTDFGDPLDYCLAARFFNKDGADDWDPSSDDGDWIASKQGMIGETWINMGYVCDNYGQNGFCINTYEAMGLGGGRDDGNCVDQWLTDQSGQPLDSMDPIYVDKVWAKVLYAPEVCRDGTGGGGGGGGDDGSGS